MFLGFVARPPGRPHQAEVAAPRRPQSEARGPLAAVA